MLDFTHILNRIFVLVLGIGAVSGTAFSAEPSQKRLPGKVVVGKAEAKDPDSQSSRILKSNDVISEKYTLHVGVASKAILVFSNGSTINLLENSSLVISEFLQDPFATPYATAIVTEEPTTSITKLNLVKGEIVCNVKKLRTNEDSSLIVNTPVGAAGAPGTIFAVAYAPDPGGNGKWTYTLSVTDGEISFTDANGNVTIVTKGKEAVISVRVTKDPETGEDTVIEILSMELREIPAERQNMINEEAAKGAESALTIFVDVMEVQLQEAFQQASDSPPIIIVPKPVTDMDS